jgi:HK97 family phage major capsid protein
MGRLAYKFGVTQESAFMTGDGVEKPLGVFTASNDGIPTSRDVSDGNAGTAIGADGLINAKHFIKSEYWPRLRWGFHRDAIKQIRKLKLGDGQYMWQAGINEDLPSRILEVPYFVSEYVPSTFTTGLYVGVIGDFSYYWIAEGMSLQIQVLNELYAESNQNGYIARTELDGMPVLSEAFARVKLG